MPYFHVQITQNRSVEYVVNAPDREAAENIAITADGVGKCDIKKILQLRADSSSGVSVSDVEKSAWLDTLKKQKAK